MTDVIVHFVVEEAYLRIINIIIYKVLKKKLAHGGNGALLMYDVIVYFKHFSGTCSSYYNLQGRI